MANMPKRRIKKPKSTPKPKVRRGSASASRRMHTRQMGRY